MDPTYAVNSWLWNRAVLTARFNRIGPPTAPDHFSNFGPVAALLQQPFIGWWPFGLYRCSVFDWNFDRARVQAAEAAVNIVRAFRPGLPTGGFAVGGIDTTALGAFHIQTHWRLSPPKFCK
jgi:hypothetical protein